MPVLLVVLATFFWGFGFIATIWGLEQFDAMSLTFLRCALAALVMAPLARGGFNRREFLSALPAGAFLGFGLILQTLGLYETTATKSGFLTTLYVLVVPLVEWAVFRRRIGAGVLVGAALASLGTLLLASPGLDSFSKGDLLTVACAVVFAFQIVAITQAQPRIKSVWAFSFWQAAIAALATLPFLSKFPPLGAITGLTWFGIAWIAVMSSVLAFSFQVRAQAVLSASVSATLFLLEGPFAALFGWWIFNDRLEAIQWAGAALVVVAAVIAVRSTARG